MKKGLKTIILIIPNKKFRQSLVSIFEALRLSFFMCLSQESTETRISFRFHPQKKEALEKIISRILLGEEKEIPETLPASQQIDNLTIEATTLGKLCAGLDTVNVKGVSIRPLLNSNDQLMSVSFPTKFGKSVRSQLSSQKKY